MHLNINTHTTYATKQREEKKSSILFLSSLCIYVYFVEAFIPDEKKQHISINRRVDREIYIVHCT